MQRSNFIGTSIAGSGTGLAKPSLIIGSRGSRLALTQTESVREAIVAQLGLPDDAVTVKPIRTSGDRIADRPLRDVGGKALFTKEIESALTAGEVDLAVHSLKDMETVLPEGLVLTAVLEREDPRDVLISGDGLSIDALPRGAVFGTSSLRRQSQVLARRPDIEIAMLRGNVETRLNKVRRGEVTATALALAGLSRIGRADDADAILDPEVMLPAVGQGMLGLEVKADNDRVREMLAPLNHAPSFAAATAERAMLAALGGDCFTPVGGYTTLDGDTIAMKARLLSPDGTQVFEAARSGAVADAEALGRDAGAQLRREAGDAFFELLKQD